MNWQTTLEVLWQAVNSPAGIAALAGLILWALNRLYAAKPLWQQYEGVIISAVKLAEKEIPDETPNKGLARLDAALKVVLAAYEQAKGKAATDAEKAALTNGISLVHADLENKGQL